MYMYLLAHSEFHNIPAYIDSDMSSVHTQEHSRHRSCKDHFDKESLVEKLSTSEMISNKYYYMAVSHKDWELPNSRI